MTEHSNTTPDWWFWAYFGTTDLLDTNLDIMGNTLLIDYEFGIDPNIIQFSLSFPNDYVSSTPVYGTIDLIGGLPGDMAVLVNDTNQTHAVWQSFDPTVVANLNAGDGVYTVMVGIRGLAPNATPSWITTSLTLNTTPLVITVTNPAAGTVWQPMIQLKGFAEQTAGPFDLRPHQRRRCFYQPTGFYHRSGLQQQLAGFGVLYPML